MDSDIQQCTKYTYIRNIGTQFSRYTHENVSFCYNIAIDFHII